MTPLKVTASAQAKIIMFEEHFVVYDAPAIDLFINKRAYVTSTLRKNKGIHILSKQLGVSASITGNRSLNNIDPKLRPIACAANTVLNTLPRKGECVSIACALPRE